MAEKVKHEDLKPSDPTIKQIEQLLIKTMRENESMLNSLLTGFVIHEADTSISFCNEKAIDILGLTYEQMMGKKAVDPGWDFIHEDLAVMSVEDYPVNKVLSTKKPYYDSVAGIRRPDREYITWIIVNAIPIFSEDNIIKKVAVNFIDFTKRKQAEHSLIESEARFKALHHASVGGIAIHDRGIILECNKGLSDMTGYSVSELIGMNGLSLIAEQSRKAVMNKIASGYEEPYESIGLRKNGEEYPMRIEGRNIPYKGKNVRTTEFRDLTDIKRAEKEKEKLRNQLMHAQKMEAIGTLAGGIAHDFNNILSAIIGYSELSLLEAEPGTNIYGNLSKVLRAGERAKNLVQQILTFSRQGEQKLLPVRIKLVVNEVVKFIRAALPTSIEIQHNIKADPTVKADPTQIHQIIMNLCTNAGHAMQDKGGTLKVGLECVELEPDLPGISPALPSGQYIKLIVSDTGKGISPENLERIFDPYFSTKEKEKGTGLGLATVHGIVKSHGGTVVVKSQEGVGTTFEVYLPMTKSSQQNEDESEPKFSGGKERILFVDDEKDIIEIAEMMLSQLGYTVTATNKAGDALKIFAEASTQFDLVISDMTMPKMTGDKLARELINIRPDIPIILCTGYSNRLSHENIKEMGIRNIVMKPLTLHNLAETVRNVLDEKRIVDVEVGKQPDDEDISA